MMLAMVSPGAHLSSPVPPAFPAALLLYCSRTRTPAARTARPPAPPPLAGAATVPKALPLSLSRFAAKGARQDY